MLTLWVAVPIRTIAKEVTALSVLAAVSDSTVSWDIGYAIGVIVVLVVVALVVPILVLAHRIGNQAAAIDDALTDAVENTSALAELTTTNDAATRIVCALRDRFAASAAVQGWSAGQRSGSRSVPPRGASLPQEDRRPAELALSR